MAAWRTLGTVVVLLAGAPIATAQTYPLSETVKAGDCFRVRLEMDLTGEIKVSRDGKSASLPLTAKATHEFPERVLVVGDKGLVEKSARVYETATATITVARDTETKSLRKERRLLVAQRPKDQALTYSPNGPLTRGELELVGDHFDTLCVTGLLPGKEVAVGDTWKVNNSAAQALCHFDGLTDQDLTCKLEAVKDKVARVSVSGPANGIELGAMVKLKIDATYHFDLEAKRLTWLEWKQTDARDQGPANPALTATSTTTLTRKPIERPDALADMALVSVPPDFKVPETLLVVEYRHPKGKFELNYARDWQVVGEPQERLILRLMERGDFVAQATITPWTPAEKGKHLSADEFKAAVTDTPGWEAEKELQAGEVPPAGEGRWIYRVSLLGKMDGMAVLQNFYLVAGPNGDQVVVAVTLTPKKAEQLGSRDLSLAGSIELPAEKK
ncbi:MAG TPA: hypothetical protein VKA46_39140 [Gemmataceae bacterium]|nr:hypothetical protein [Gemmataceae bacterium]